MGRNKAFLVLEGERLIDRTARILRMVFRDLIIVTDDPFAYLDQEATLVTDILPGKGALGGLYTGLLHATGEQAFIVACDMPFLNPLFVEYMVRQAEGYDIVVPAPPDGLQPLHAIYSRRCLPAIRALLDRNALQVKGFYSGHSILRISPPASAAFDPEGRMFLNVNNPDDLAHLAPGPP